MRVGVLLGVAFEGLVVLGPHELPTHQHVDKNAKPPLRGKNIVASPESSEEATRKNLLQLAGEIEIGP